MRPFCTAPVCTFMAGSPQTQQHQLAASLLREGVASQQSAEYVWMTCGDWTQVIRVTYTPSDQTIPLSLVLHSLDVFPTFSLIAAPHCCTDTIPKLSLCSQPRCRRNGFCLYCPQRPVCFRLLFQSGGRHSCLMRYVCVCSDDDVDSAENATGSLAL